MNVNFQHTDYLIELAAIPLLIILYFFVLNWKKRTIKKIGDANLVAEMIKNHSPQKFALKFVLILVAFAAGVFALANLRSPKGVEQVNRNGIDVMIALDVSKSMLAQDVKPNRLERVRGSGLSTCMRASTGLSSMRVPLLLTRSLPVIQCCCR